MTTSKSPSCHLFLGALLLATAGCTSGTDTGSLVDTEVIDTDVPYDPNDPQDWRWDLPPGYPRPIVPEDNPMTHAKVELGRYLFYDIRLSFNESTSCASCHEQALSFADPRALSEGATGDLTPRNAPGLQNIAFYATFNWADPTLRTLTDQVAGPMFQEHPVELGITGHEDEVRARFVSDETYIQMFETAFPNDPDAFSWIQFQQALASFVRSMVSVNSPYDQFTLHGDASGMSDAAIRGMNLFFDEVFECHHCHGGFHLSRSVAHRDSPFVELAFDNTGLYNLDGRGAYPQQNTGLHASTGLESDMGRFRPPSLRNVSLTAPYMHDGSIESLQEVMAFYQAGGRVIEDGALAGDGRNNPYKSGFVSGFDASKQDIDDVIAFLETMSDTEFLRDSRFADPFEQTRP